MSRASHVTRLVEGEGELPSLQVVAEAIAVPLSEASHDVFETSDACNTRDAHHSF